MSYVNLNADNGEVTATYTSDAEHIEELESERDSLREALIKESEYQMGNYGSCAEWITKALEKTP